MSGCFGIIFFVYVVSTWYPFLVNSLQVILPRLEDPPIINDTLFIGGAILIGANHGVSGTPLWVPSDIASYTISATIDSNNEITELIESNNVLTASLLVTNTLESITPNLCYQKPVNASSIESLEYTPENVVDGNFSTRWSSQFSDPQHIVIDLLDLYHIDMIALGDHLNNVRS